MNVNPSQLVMFILVTQSISFKLCLGLELVKGLHHDWAARLSHTGWGPVITCTVVIYVIVTNTIKILKYMKSTRV